jgi:cobalt-zinc-cadmium efflux system protein
MGHDHTHDHVGDIRHERPLWWALALTGGVLLAELVGAWLTNSLALLSDAAHMATDTLALAIALVTVRLARRPPDAQRTFGYARLEAIGALFNGVLLFAIAGYILWEAAMRFRDPPAIATPGMAIVAAVGLAANFAAMRLLAAGRGENLALRAAYLEVWSDLLGSAAVLAGAALIALTGWRLVDPVLAVALGLWVLPRTWALVRDALHILLEGVPRGMPLEQVRQTMATVPGVASIHDLHVWSLSSQQPSLAAHGVLEPEAEAGRVRGELARVLEKRFGLHHVTLQMEASACDGPVCEVPAAPGQAARHDHDHAHDHGAAGHDA